MKPFIVYFTRNNARIVKDENTVKALIGHPSAVLSPDLKKVRGYPPHLWKRTPEGILPLNEAETVERLAFIAEYGIDNRVEVPEQEPVIAPVEPKAVVKEPSKAIEKLKQLAPIYLSGALSMYLIQKILELI